MLLASHIPTESTSGTAARKRSWGERRSLKGGPGRRIQHDQEGRRSKAWGGKAKARGLHSLFNTYCFCAAFFWRVKRKEAKGEIN